MKDAVARFNEKIDFLIIGEKATSYRLPLIVNSVKEYEGKICIETKNIRDMYIVFDKTTFLKSLGEYLEQYNINIGENINGNEKT